MAFVQDLAGCSGMEKNVLYPPSANNFSQGLKAWCTGALSGLTIRHYKLAISSGQLVSSHLTSAIRHYLLSNGPLELLLQIVQRISLGMLANT